MSEISEHIMHMRVAQAEITRLKAELERFKHMAEQNSTEMCEWMEKANKAREEAARECMQICDDLDAEGYYYEINNHAIVKDRIAAKFGLEG